MESVVVKDEQHQLVGDSVRETIFKKAEAVRVKNEKARSETYQIERRKTLETKLKEKREEYKKGLEALAEIWFKIPKEAFLVFDDKEHAAIESDVLEKAKRHWRIIKVVAKISVPSFSGLIVYLGLKFDLVLFLLLLVPVALIGCLSDSETKKLIQNHKILNSENPMKEIEKEIH